MYAPSFPSYLVPHPCWHKAHPLDLVHSVCSPSIVLNGVKARNDVPADEKYCSVCASRERFVKAFEKEPSDD